MTRFKKMYQEKIIPAMKEKIGYKNDFCVPKIQKVVINIGIGETKENPKLREMFERDLMMLSGQKPVATTARKAISGFKIRIGDKIGLKVTLRGSKMYDFLERLNTIALPRIRDFRGLKSRGFDKQGNYNLGIKEHIVFPEIKYDKAERTFGLQVTINTNTKNAKEAKQLMELFGFQFEKVRSANG